MKLKFLSIPIIALYTLISCSDDNKITCKLTGEISDRKDGNLFLYRPESSRFDKDTIPFKNGQFEYIKKINSPELYWLFFKEDENNGGGFTSVDLFIEQGNVNVRMSMEDIKNYQINDRILNTKLYSFKRELKTIEDKADTLYKELSVTKDSLNIHQKKSKIDSLYKLYENTLFNYIENNSDLISAYYLWSLRKSTDKVKLEKLLIPLENMFPNSRYIIETKAFIEGFGKNQPQQQFIDFKLLNRDGEETSLTDIISNNKATFILFWSSRCSFSDGKLKAYKPIYNEYKELGFEIIGVADDYNLTRWEKAIERNKANWINMVDLDGKNAIDEYYHSNTEGDVLIDNSGKILARNLRTSQLKELLEEMLK